MNFVLEFVLEWASFYSPVVKATLTVKNRVFPRKSTVFGNEKKRFEIDDFGILSLARLPIPPPWLAAGG
jgi:hypothetical protein